MRCQILFMVPRLDMTGGVRGRWLATHAVLHVGKNKGKFVESPDKSPTFSSCGSHTHSTSQSQTQFVRRGRRVRSSPPPCVLCNQVHTLSQCADFKALSVPDLITLVKTKSICCNCLKRGHSVDDCFSNRRCFVCQEKHYAFVHVDDCKTNVGYVAPCSMPTVRVFVNAKVWAKAALDTCSSNTFCTASLAKRLGINGPTAAYTLKTMNGALSGKSQFVSMTFAFADQSMTLSGVKVLDNIPVTSSNLDQHLYPHLKGLDLTANINCREVDILIGQDFADVLFPLDTRVG